MENNEKKSHLVLNTRQIDATVLGRGFEELSIEV